MRIHSMRRPSTPETVPPQLAYDPEDSMPLSRLVRQAPDAEISACLRVFERIASDVSDELDALVRISNRE